MPKRQSDRDLYWGSDFRRDGGVNVLVCSCLGERTVCVWGVGRGVTEGLGVGAVGFR